MTDAGITALFSDNDRGALDEQVCECWKKQYGGARYGATCNGAYGQPDADCARAYGADCTRLLECVRRDPASPPARDE